MRNSKLIAGLILFGLAAPLLAIAGETVVIVNPAATPPSKDEISDIYLGKSQSLSPIDLPESSPVYAAFYQKATGRDVAQVKATWARVTFTGKGQPPKQVADAAAVKKAVASDPKAVGYIDKADVDGTVKVALSLN